ncbi:hypothetical protein FKP32DRAFT_519874 [Trametes sanguinea]|nr:hypothetical protein FKP32DRAFT_519874 [Trametes sanguinea]
MVERTIPQLQGCLALLRRVHPCRRRASTGTYNCHTVSPISLCPIQSPVAVGHGASADQAIAKPGYSPHHWRGSLKPVASPHTPRSLCMSESPRRGL